jgi:polysaccharide biosynthesis protein PslH
MRIAYVVPYVPNRIRTRSYNFIAQLTALGHEVTVSTLGSNRQEFGDADALQDKCREVYYHSQPTWRSLLNSAAAVPSSQPLQSVYSWQGSMARLLAQRISRRDFDIVHVEHLRGSRYGTFVKSRFPNMPVVWDSVDCISHLFRQASSQSRSLFGKFVTRFELPRTAKTEGDLIYTFDHVLVTSPVDRDALLELAKKRKRPSQISVLPNGVDLDYFWPNQEIRRDPEAIVFSGKMSYHANITMARHLVTEIMPRIWTRRPGAHLYIVGKDPSREIRELQKDPRIEVTGTVDDIRPFLWRATVSVVPLLYGAGIQNKILEAMASGTPVVASCRALLAFQAQPGKDLLASNDPEEFAQAVVRVMEDQSLNDRLRAAGLIYTRAFHDWNQIASELAGVYRHCLTSAGSSTDG